MMKNKTAKLLITGLLSLILIISSGMAPVSATSTATGVDILFYVPDSWSTDYYGPKIHLWNAGSYNTTWPGTEMTYVKNGVYRYTNFNISSCNFVINDGYGNSQTANLHTNGKITVKDGNIINRSQHPTQIRFRKPSGWGDNIRIYYYSADSSETEIYSWPGTEMEKEDVFQYWGAEVYNYEITEFENCRVMFTDGVNQYPAADQPGILVNAGNTYYITDSYVNSESYYTTTLNPSTNQVMVGQEFKIILDTANSYSRYITDSQNGMEIVDEEILFSDTERIVKEYTVKFTTAGAKKVYAYGAYLGMGEYLGKSVDIKVFDPNNSNTSDMWGFVRYIDNLTPEVQLGQPCQVKLELTSSPKMGFIFVTEDGEVVDPSWNSQTSSYSFTINRYCENMKVYVYSYGTYSPYSRFYGGYFTTTVK